MPRATRFELVTIAEDVQGPDVPMSYVKRAGVTGHTWIDGAGLIPAHFGLKKVPLTLLLDEGGRVLISGGAPDSKLLSKIDEAIRQPACSLEPPGGYPSVSTPMPEREIALQSVTNFIVKNRKEEGLALLKRLSGDDPDNWILKKQVWAMEFPDRFYAGEIDCEWQAEQGLPA